MRAIVCGGRHWRPDIEHFAWLHKLVKDLKITRIVTGGCEGVDIDVAVWAIRNRIAVSTYPADWEKWEPLDKKKKNPAGVIRNTQMLKRGAGVIIVFPGGKGTTDMMNKGRRNKKDIIMWEDQ